MKKFNKSKVIIPALAMIALSTAASATGTVAWFAANGAVSVSGLQVGIKNENVFLLVSDDKTTAEEIQAQKKTSITYENDDVSLAPSHPKKDNENKDIVKNLTTASNVGNWETGISNDPSKSTPTDGVSLTDLESFTGFVRKYDFYLTLAKGSATAYNLKVSSYTITATSGKNIDAVRALFATSTTVQTFSTSDSTPADNTVLAASMDDANVVALSVFVYYDGTDASVYTNNANLDGASISFQLSVSATNA
jgi:hypothetical protein